MSTVATVPVMIVLVLIILLPFIVGFFVYRDARQRNMNAILWALVAALAPAFIGLIVYLLVRGNYMNLRCPQCSTPVMETYVVCPKCGAKLRPSCPNCKAPVELDWKVCPRCTTPLPEFQDDIQTPVRPKDLEDPSGDPLGSAAADSACCLRAYGTERQRLRQYAGIEPG